MSEKFSESAFQKWYANWAKKLKLNPDPDNPLHYYDWRAAYTAGATPNASGHWPSTFKLPGHPNLYVGGINTKTGAPQYLDQTQQLNFNLDLLEKMFQKDKNQRLMEQAGMGYRMDPFKPPPSLRYPMTPEQEKGRKAFLQQLYKNLTRPIAFGVPGAYLMKTEHPEPGGHTIGGQHFKLVKELPEGWAGFDPVMTGVIHGVPEAKGIRAAIAAEHKLRGKLYKETLPYAISKSGFLSHEEAVKDVVDEITRGTWFHGRQSFPEQGMTFGASRVRKSEFGEPYGISLGADPQLYKRGFAQPTSTVGGERVVQPATALKKRGPARAGEYKRAEKKFHPSMAYPELWGTGDPDLAARVLGRVFPRFGAPPTEAILPAWKGKGTEWAQDIIKESYVDVIPKATISDLLRMHYEGFNVDSKKIYEVVKSRFGQTTDAVNQFNLRLADKFLEKGWRGFLYSPGRYSEFELRMFDPEDVLMLDTRHLEDLALKRQYAWVTPTQRREINFYLDKVNDFERQIATLGDERRQIIIDTRTNVDAAKRWRELIETDPLRREAYEKAIFSAGRRNEDMYERLAEIDKQSAGIQKERDAWYAKYSELESKAGAAARKRIERWEKTAPGAYEEGAHLKAIYSDISVDDLKRIHPEIDQRVKIQMELSEGKKDTMQLYSKWLHFWEEKGWPTALADNAARQASIKGIPVPKSEAVPTHEAWTQLSSAEKSKTFHLGNVYDYVTGDAESLAIKRFLQKNAASPIASGKGKATMPPKKAGPSPFQTPLKKEVGGVQQTLDTLAEMKISANINTKDIEAYMAHQGMDVKTASVKQYNLFRKGFEKKLKLLVKHFPVTPAEAVKLIHEPEKWDNLFDIIEKSTK